MQVLSLDISSSTGWASFDTDVGPSSLRYGCIVLPKRARDYAVHPWGYYDAALQLAKLLLEKVGETFHNPDEEGVLLVEETNGARARFTQKFLEYCHFAFLHAFFEKYEGCRLKVVYINTSEWRKVTSTCLSKEDKNRNARLSRLKRKAREVGQTLSYQDKQRIGIAGKTTIKHVAIRRVRELYGIELLAKDDDCADAILLLRAHLDGAQPCTGSEKR